MIHLVFAGETLTGVPQSTANIRLAKLLGQSPEVVADKLFCGKPVLVKQVGSPETAWRWRKAFAEAGAVLLVVRPPDREPDSPPDANLDFNLDPSTLKAWDLEPDSANPQATTYEEPTMSSILLRLPGVRRRNRAFLGMGIAVLAVVFLVILVARLSRPLWQ